MKHRLLRVRELLKRELSDIIQKEGLFEGVLVSISLRTLNRRMSSSG
jgi:hypothetical protein